VTRWEGRPGEGHTDRVSGDFDESKKQDKSAVCTYEALGLFEAVAVVRRRRRGDLLADPTVDGYAGLAAGQGRARCGGQGVMTVLRGSAGLGVDHGGLACPVSR
jgi:hypothetical protein